MNILIVNWQDRTNPLAGGAEVHLHEIFSRIVRRGHHVTLCCCTYPGSAPQEFVDGIEVIRRGSRSFFNFRFPLTYASLLKRRDFDVVIEDLNKIPFFTPLFIRRPLVGIAHHLFGRSIFLETGYLAASYVYWAERAALSLYRRRMPFMVVSPSTQAEFERLGFAPGRLAVIHNCVDHARYNPGMVAKSPFPLVVSSGRLKKYKCIDHLLRAVPSVLSRFPNMRVVIAGDGDDLPRLKECARKLGLTEVVEFSGFLPEEKMIDLLRRAWLTVAPSSKEGWGLTVVEANACGTPAIASAVPGLRDAVRESETGLLYPFGDVAALGARMALLLENDELRLRLSRNAMAWAQSFRWDEAAEKTIAFLETWSGGKERGPNSRTR